jgi:hypothetical protein
MSGIPNQTGASSESFQSLSINWIKNGEKKVNRVFRRIAFATEDFFAENSIRNPSETNAG